MIDINETKYGFEVQFSYRPYLVEGVKQFQPARYNGAGKFWTIGLEHREALFEWAIKMGMKPKSAEPQIDVTQIEELPELSDLGITIPLRVEMFHYQGKGVAYSLKQKQTTGRIGVIVGDEPGLGKTGQAIATVEGAGSKCVLVICPASLKQNWKSEIEDMWTFRKAAILTDRIKTSWPVFNKVGSVKYFIVNYESLKKFFVQSINIPKGEDGKPKPLRLNHITFNSNIDMFDAVIIDEVHRCKEGKTQQSKFVMGICKGKEVILALTGTPVVNKPKDLIPQLHIIGKLDNFGGYKRFTDRYCAGWNEASNLRELNYYLHKNCFYRRLKKEVLKDLPDKVYSTVSIEITNRLEYKKAEDAFIEYLRENMGKSEEEIDRSLRGEVMVRMGILRKIAARGKVEQVLENIKEITEAGEKVVVFAWHKEIVRELQSHLPGSVTIVGDDSLDQRNDAVTAFQKCKVCGVKLEKHKNQDHEHVPSDTNEIICNIKSGGVGITLTAASRVLLIEEPWNPAGFDQCTDRCHRIGQKDSVQCISAIGTDTIDEYIHAIIEKKRLIVNQVVGTDGEQPEQQENSVIDEFIKNFTAAKL